MKRDGRNISQVHENSAQTLSNQNAFNVGLNATPNNEPNSVFDSGAENVNLLNNLNAVPPVRK